MDHTKDWDAHEREAREKLGALAYLVGTWEGEGTGHDQPIRGRLVVRPILGDTFLEARETLLDAAGEADYEDLALYRYDPEEGGLRVTHVQAPAWVMEREVVPLDGGGHQWLGGPVSPRVDIRPTDDGLLFEVWMPFRGQPDVVMRYRPA